MSDWLEEIKEAYYDTTCDPEIELSPKAIERLISEVERLRELVEKKDKVIKFRVDGQNQMTGQIEQLRADNEQLEFSDSISKSAIESYKEFTSDLLNEAELNNDEKLIKKIIELEESINGSSHVV